MADELLAHQTLTIFGGTGVSGLLAIRALLSRGHRIRAFTRSPNKIPEDLRDVEELDIVEGELVDVDKLREVIVGANAVLSFLGRKSVLRLFKYECQTRHTTQHILASIPRVSP